MALLSHDYGACATDGLVAGFLVALLMQKCGACAAFGLFYGASKALSMQWHGDAAAKGTGLLRDTPSVQKYKVVLSWGLEDFQRCISLFR